MISILESDGQLPRGVPVGPVLTLPSNPIGVYWPSCLYPVTLLPVM